MADAPEIIEVEVAYARPDEQVILTVAIPEGQTIEDAIRASHIMEHFPEIDLTRNDVGIFGRVRPRDTVLKTGDRVEIYRPLLADPRVVRRRLAAQGKVMGRGKAEEA
jgi:putative ubiquitin-RnfH superfamily antitoxin RatB of RatAB toxin-antitoxin module